MNQDGRLFALGVCKAICFAYSWYMRTGHYDRFVVRQILIDFMKQLEKK